MKTSLKKIVIIGPESTGKSTLSSALASHYGTRMVPEFARAYLDNLDRDYEEADLLSIAKGQIAAEELASRHVKNHLICDTDLNVIKVWSEHKYQRCSTAILQTIAVRKYDLYLLTDIDFPWQEDRLREHPEPEMRHYFFQVYLDLVQQSGVPFAVISGNKEQRLQQAIAVIEAQNLGC